jgi:hypothetical protein
MTPQRLARYTRLKALQASITIQLDELRDEILAADPATFPTTWRVTITESTSDRLVGLSEIKDKSRKLYDALISTGCVKQTTAKRLTVKRIAE